MIPQYLREKGFPLSYKVLTLAVVFISLLPELSIPFLVLLFLPFFYKTVSNDGKKQNVTRLYKAYIVYALFVSVSFIWAQHMFPSLIKGAMWFILLLAAVYVVCLSDTKEKIENIMLCMIGSAALNAVVSIIQMAFMAIGKSKYFPISFYRPLDEKLLAAMSVAYPIDSIHDRVTGFFDSPLILATFFIIVFPLAAFCCFYASTKKRRLFSMLSCALIFFGILFTFLRGAVAAIIVSFMILAFTGKKPAKVMSVIAMISAFIMLVVIFLRRGVSTAADISTTHRLHIWAVCLQSIKEKPLLGIGSGAFNVSEYLAGAGYDFPNSHNLFIEILTEEGIVGFALFAVLIVVIMLNIYNIYKCGGWWKRFAVALVSSFAGFFTMSLFDYTLYTPKEMLYFLIVVGMVEAAFEVAPKHRERYDIEPQSMIKIK